MKKAVVENSTLFLKREHPFSVNARCFVIPYKCKYKACNLLKTIQNTICSDFYFLGKVQSRMKFSQPSRLESCWGKFCSTMTSSYFPVLCFYHYLFILICYLFIIWFAFTFLMILCCSFLLLFYFWFLLVCDVASSYIQCRV